MSDAIVDVQNNPDKRNIIVDQVGVKGVKHPFSFTDIAFQAPPLSQSTIGVFDMMVDLPKNVKGTHMSRFIEMLNEQAIHLSVSSLPTWLHTMVQRLQASCGYFRVQFPFFMQKRAPVSHVVSMMDYQVLLTGQLQPTHPCTVCIEVIVPVTSLCPCSKEISRYGAHNQRSHVTVTAHVAPHFSLRELITLIENQASCELYSVLKRSDEKFVTERAYENPKFVEDTVRDIACVLETLDSIYAYKVSSENFESIHNHSAFAQIDTLWVHAPQPIKEKTSSY